MMDFKGNMTLEHNSSNPWLLSKRRNLVGDPDFIPASYLHLAYFWGYITEKEYIKGCKYSKLKMLLDQVQENWVDWIHKIPQNLGSRSSISSDQEEQIEAIWRQVRQRLCPKDMIALDWLVQESLSYDWNRETLGKHLRMVVQTLHKI